MVALASRFGTQNPHVDIRMPLPMVGEPECLKADVLPNWSGHITRKMLEGDATTVLIAEIHELRYGIEKLKRQSSNIVTTDKIDRRRRFGEV